MLKLDEDDDYDTRGDGRAFRPSVVCHPEDPTLSRSRQRRAFRRGRDPRRCGGCGNLVERGLKRVRKLDGGFIKLCSICRRQWKEGLI